MERFWSSCDPSLADSGATGRPVNIDMTLRSWHGVDAPRRSFYGLVSAAELAVLYKDHGAGLFEKNIRHFLGSQPVNDAIIATLTDKPSELFYLNNGLTAICTSIVPKPGATQAQGIFALKALSIVNGAQTVGAIDKSATTSGAVSNEAYVLITLIEIGEADVPGAKYHPSSQYAKCGQWDRFRRARSQPRAIAERADSFWDHVSVSSETAKSTQMMPTSSLSSKRPWPLLAERSYRLGSHRQEESKASSMTGMVLITHCSSVTLFLGSLLPDGWRFSSTWPTSSGAPSWPSLHGHVE